jgi:TonB family protein
MQLRLSIALCGVLACACARLAAQDSSSGVPATSNEAANSAHESGFIKMQVHKLGNEVVAPELLTPDYSKILGSNCERTQPVWTTLTFVVDEAGVPHQILADENVDGNVATLLFAFMKSARFKPALLNGAPVAVGLSDKIAFTACYMKATDDAGKTTHRITMLAVPSQQFAAWNKAPSEIMISRSPLNDTGKAKIERTGVKAPVAVYTVDPAFSTQARSQNIQGTIMVTVIVDTDGSTQSIEVVRPLGYGLDQKAIEAVRKYRFKPATKDCRPVPIFLTIAINFRLT